MDPSGMRPENIIALMSTHKIAFQVDHGGCGQVAVHEFFLGADILIFVC